MTCALPPTPICIRRGATNDIPLRIDTGRWRYVAITAIQQSAPIRITAPAHAIPHQWRGVIIGVEGMDEINTFKRLARLLSADYRRFDVIDADTLEINDVSAGGFGAYLGGGYIVIPEPLDLSAYSAARMQVNDPATGAQLAWFSTDAGTLELDTANAALRLKQTPSQSAALGFAAGVYDVELVTPAGAVLNPVSPLSPFTVVPENTTDHA